MNLNWHIYIYIFHNHKEIDVGYQPKTVVAFCFSEKGTAAHTGDPFWELVCVTKKIPNLKNKPKFSKKCKSLVKIAENPCFETFSL